MDYKIVPKERDKFKSLDSPVMQIIKEINESHVKVSEAISKYNHLLAYREEVATIPEEYLRHIRLDSYEKVNANRPFSIGKFIREFLMKGLEYELDEQEKVVDKAIEDIKRKLGML